MTGAVLRWLPLSVALHAAALLAVLLLPREVALAPLFVDLTLPPAAPEPPPSRESAPGSLQTSPRPAPPSVSDRSTSAPPAAARSASLPSTPRVSTSVPPHPAPAPAPSTGHASMATAPSTSAPSVVPPPAAVTETAPSLPSPPPPVASPPASLPTPPAASSAPPAAVSSAAGDPGREGPVPVRPGHGASGDIAGTAAPEGGPGGEDAIGATAGIGGDAAAGGGTGGGTLALAIPGDGASAYGPYLALLRRRVQEAMTYPAAARRRGLSGTVHLEIALDPSGEISDVTLARSSAHRLLDDTAVESVRSLRRVPFPPDVRPRALRVRLPVVFELR